MDRKRPGPLLAIAIVGLILGSLGTCGACFGVVSQFGQDKLNDASISMLRGQPGQTEETINAQIRMQTRLREITDPLTPALIAYQVLNLLASLALIAGCVLLLQWKPSAPKVFLGATIASLLVDLPGGALAGWIQYVTGQVMSQEMASGAQLTDPALGAGAERTMGAAIDASATMGICVGIAWVVLKLSYYAWGLVYVRKPETKALFAAK